MFALALAIALAAHPSSAADPVYVGSIQEGLTAPMSLAVDGDRIVVLEPYARQIAAYSADGLQQQRLDIDARARGLARLGSTTYLFCDRGRGSIRSVDLAQATSSVFLDPGGDPVDVVVEGARCYILDAGGTISVTDRNGVVQETVRLVPPAGVVFVAPMGLVFDPARGRFHVLDQVACTVMTFATDGTYLGTFCSFGVDAGQVTRPGEIAGDADGRVYVCDRFQGRVAVFDVSGEFLCNIDPVALGAPQLVVPTGVAVDANGLIYVASTEARRVQLFYLSSSDAAPLSALPIHPADRAGVFCDDLRLLAAVAGPARAPLPTGADLRVLQGDDLSVTLAEVTNHPALRPEGVHDPDSLVAEWRPELECVQGKLYAWQARARSDTSVGPWSPHRWFLIDATVVDLHLGHSFPNPFRTRAVIPFQAPADSDVHIQIFDVQGRAVWARALSELTAGYNELVWDACDERGERVAAGVYFYRLSSGSYTATRKTVLLR
jgi:hypothetical protein